MKKLLKSFETVTHDLQQWPKVNHTHPVYQLVESLFKGLSSFVALYMEVLLNLDKPVADGVEEIWFEIIGIVLPDEFNNDRDCVGSGGNGGVGVG